SAGRGRALPAAQPQRRLPLPAVEVTERMAPTGFVVSDNHHDEVAVRTARECADALAEWFEEHLWACLQCLCEEGVEDSYPGLLARLRTAVASVARPADDAGLPELGAYARALGDAVESACTSPDER